MVCLGIKLSDSTNNPTKIRDMFYGLWIIHFYDLMLYYNIIFCASLIQDQSKFLTNQWILKGLG